MKKKNASEKRDTPYSNSLKVRGGGKTLSIIETYNKTCKYTHEVIMIKPIKSLVSNSISKTRFADFKKVFGYIVLLMGKTSGDYKLSKRAG